MHSVTAQDLASLAAESVAAYSGSPFAPLSRDCFARFSRDPKAQPRADEVAIGADWKIVLPENLSPVGRTMAKDLAGFLAGRMGVEVSEAACPAGLAAGMGSPPPPRSIILLETGGGDPKVPESFTISVAKDCIVVAGFDAAGLRAGVVRLVGEIGLRQAPFLALGSRTYTPRLPVRLGQAPCLGSFREVAFLGYNAVFISAYISGGSLYALSTSDAIPELAARRNPAALAQVAEQARAAGRYGLKCCIILDTRQKFPKDDPVFKAHPDIRGSQTWNENGEYVLCTEHPLVKRYLCESMAGLFRAVPELSGAVIIIGGEGFYHCHMRAHKPAMCPRCAKLGAETVVSNLCNNLAEAARKVRPDAEIIAWPYSAYNWSADSNQEQLIAKLKPGAAIFTEVEKDEHIRKPNGVDKVLWDYSIDMVGLGERAKRQLAACRKAGIPIYFKSEPGTVFEAPGLPQVPCLDRWWQRAEAIAGSGANGLFCISGFHTSYGGSAEEVYRLAGWNPVPAQETALDQLAARIAGPGGPHLRAAWKAVSDAIPFVPELPPYYTGPYYLGPAHPMLANPAAALPDVFYGRFLFMAEETEAEGRKLRPTFLTAPRGNVPVFGKMYRQMEAHLKKAADGVKAAEPLVPERCRLVFRSETLPILWFHATARAHANFYEACSLRDEFAALAKQNPKSREKLKAVYDRWLAVLRDERQNAADALPVAEADMRLDSYYGGDHSFCHMTDMIRAKLAIIDSEINEYLPSLWKSVESAR